MGRTKGNKNFMIMEGDRYLTDFEEGLFNTETATLLVTRVASLREEGKRGGGGVGRQEKDRMSESQSHLVGDLTVSSQRARVSVNSTALGSCVPHTAPCVDMTIE